ncbi:hypothetical protein [Candidatus Harpocratesius sp.]
MNGKEIEIRSYLINIIEFFNYSEINLIKERLSHEYSKPLLVLFHGTIYKYVASIITNGLYIKSSEPNLTLNPATAMLKYANPGLNSNHIYSKEVWVSVSDLIKNNKIKKSKKKSELLSQAINYWAKNPCSGAMFVIESSNLEINSSNSGQLKVMKNKIEGGTSKWINCHLGIVKPLNHSKNIEKFIISPKKIIGMALPTIKWNSFLKKFDPLKFDRFLTYNSYKPELNELLTNPESFIWFEKKEVENYLSILSSSIYYGLIFGLFLQNIRKIILGIFDKNGFPIWKNDFLPSVHYPTLNKEQYSSILKRFGSLIYEDRIFDKYRKICLNKVRRLKEFMEK